MKRKYCLLATEGPHDQAAIAQLLKLSGLERFSDLTKELDPFWEGFIPKYPKGIHNISMRLPEIRQPLLAWSVS